MRWRWSWMLLLLVWAACLPMSVAQSSPATSLTSALTSLASRAATSFVGQVVAVERRAGVVVVSFRVEQPVIGAAESTYQLCEWAGLWPQGQVRYTVGERALIFLHGKGPSGLATPVDGGEGVLPVLVQGINVAPLVDVRRLDAAVLHPVGAPLPSETEGAVALPEALAIVRDAVAPDGARRRMLADPIRRALTGSKVSPPLPETVQVPSGLPLSLSATSTVRGIGRASGAEVLRARQ